MMYRRGIYLNIHPGKSIEPRIELINVRRGVHGDGHAGRGVAGGY